MSDALTAVRTALQDLDDSIFRIRDMAEAGTMGPPGDPDPNLLLELGFKAQRQVSDLWYCVSDASRHLISDAWKLEK